MQRSSIVVLSMLGLVSAAWGDCGNGLPELQNQSPLYRCNWGCPASGRSGSTTYRASSVSDAQHTCQTDTALDCADTSCSCSIAD